MLSTLTHYATPQISQERLQRIELIQNEVASICSQFDTTYWYEIDQAKNYPQEFVETLQNSGYLNLLIPKEYGGSGDGLLEASVALQTVSESGAYAGACHAQLYTMYSLLRHGSSQQKQELFPKLASGEARLLSFGVTEPEAGTDTTSLNTTATQEGDFFKIQGKKVWIGRIFQTNYMLLLARTTPLAEVTKKTNGLTLLLVDVVEALKNGTLQAELIDGAINSHSCRLTFQDLLVPVNHVIGQKDKGFRVVLEALNAERILIASESVGNGYYLLERARNYAKDRIVFNRPIGKNQGVQFPLARAYSQLKSAELAVREAVLQFESGKPSGEIANIAKLVATEAAFNTADVCMDTFGGYAFDNEYGIERKFRETRLYRNAPIATNLILSFLAEQALGLPRSF